MNQEDLNKRILLEKNKFARMYKKCFVWLLISESSSSEIEEKLLQTQFGEVNNLIILIGMA